MFVILYSTLEDPTPPFTAPEPKTTGLKKLAEAASGTAKSLVGRAKPLMKLPVYLHFPVNYMGLM